MRPNAETQTSRVPSFNDASAVTTKDSDAFNARPVGWYMKVARVLDAAPMRPIEVMLAGAP